MFISNFIVVFRPSKLVPKSSGLLICDQCQWCSGIRLNQVCGRKLSDPINLLCFVLSPSNQFDFKIKSNII